MIIHCGTNFFVNILPSTKHTSEPLFCTLPAHSQLGSLVFDTIMILLLNNNFFF
jgi:hypothetical protein